MIKYYYFLSERKIDKAAFEICFRNSYGKFLDFDYFTETTGVILSDENFYYRLKNIISLVQNDLGAKLLILETYELEDIYKDLLLSLKENGNCGLFCLSDAVLNIYIKDSNSDLLKKLHTDFFTAVNRELLLTAYSYIDCNLNASLAAKEMYVHRNTFNYRINKFIERTNLDIREFRNALYLYTLKGLYNN